MKKRIFKLGFIVLAIVSVNFGCSNDSSSETYEIQNSDTKGSLKSASITTLDSYYKQMLSSNSYKAFDVDNQDFMKKLNIKGDISFLKSEADFKSWLSNNISKTLFINYNDANTHFERLKSKYAIVIDENKNFFYEAENSPTFGTDFPQLLNPVVTPPNPNPVTPYDNCIFECINSAVRCDKRAQENYAAQMGASGIGYFYNTVVAIGAAVVATIIYNNAQEACVDSLNSCRKNCR